jgi:hypothetical protein
MLPRNGIDELRYVPQNACAVGEQPVRPPALAYAWRARYGPYIASGVERSAPHAHPSTDDHDDTVEAHYACLELPCACIDGWVFVGYIDEHGEEREASYACRRCAANAR